MLRPREEEAIILLGRGMSHAEVCAQLGIAPGTLKVHLRNAYERDGEGDHSYHGFLYRMVARLVFGADEAATQKAYAEGYAAGSLDGEHRGYERGQREAWQLVQRAFTRLAKGTPER